MNILRLTRHELTPSQYVELCRIYGNCLIITDVNETIPGVKRVIELVDEHKADVLEVVLPLPLLADVLWRVNTLPIIRASMNRVVNMDDGSVTFVFDHYERIHRIVVETERL